MRGARGGRATRLAAGLGIGLGMALGLGVAAGAGAAPFVDVTYDLRVSSAEISVDFSAIGGGVVVDESSPVGILGTQTVRYASNSASVISAGPLSLRSLGLSMDFRLTTSLGYRVVTPTIYLSLLDAPQPGSLVSPPVLYAKAAGSGTVSLLGASGRFGITGRFHCYGDCATFGLPATSRSPIGTTAVSTPLPTLVADYTGGTGVGLHRLRGTITHRFGLDLGADSPFPATVVTQLVGREVARTPVPEPSTLPLLAAGLAALGIAGAAWRGRG